MLLGSKGLRVLVFWSFGVLGFWGSGVLVALGFSSLRFWVGIWGEEGSVAAVVRCVCVCTPSKRPQASKTDAQRGFNLGGPWTLNPYSLKWVVLWVPFGVLFIRVPYYRGDL